MTKQNNTLIIIGILLVLAIFVLPKLDLFAVYQPTTDAIFPIEDSRVDEDKSTNYGFENYLRFGYASGSDCDDEYRTYMKFELDKNSELYRTVREGNHLTKADLYVYVSTIGNTVDIVMHETTNDWNENTINWNNKPSTGASITSFRFSVSDDDDYIRFQGLANYIETKIRADENVFSIVIQNDDRDCAEKVIIRSKDSLWKYRPFLDIDYPSLDCIENEIKADEGIYYICRDQRFIEIVNFVALSDEEQARLMDIINQLELTIGQKAEIIKNLTTTLEGQLAMITQLELLTAEKAEIIKQLELNLEEQATLITEMQLTVAEQYIIIEQLDLTIQEQADLINQMKINLAAKAALIQLLQVENENQARLIAEMELSFADQAEIIKALENLIGDDAEIILALYDTIDEQAQLINQLEFTKEELAKLITAMGLTIAENADLINQLELTTEEQLEIIANLELSLEQEKALVEQLRLTIEEQQKLIEDLKDKEDDLFDLQEFWDKYKIFIIAGGVILLLLLLAGGKKR